MAMMTAMNYNYLDCVSKLHALIVDSDTINILIAGDFNCSAGSRFFNDFSDFVPDNNLVLSDMNRLKDVSDDVRRMSWVDHIVCSVATDSILSDISVMHDVITSDHRLISFCIQSTIDTSPMSLSPDLWQDDGHTVPCWDTRDAFALHRYTGKLDLLLQSISVPYFVFNCAYDVNLCAPAIDKFYIDVMSCISTAMSETIPIVKHNNRNFNVPGWLESLCQGKA